MKKEERQFCIYKGDRPKVLLLGNGVCQAYDGLSWDGLLDEIKDTKKYPNDAEKYIMPMPLKAVMLTNNSLAKKMREITEEKEKPFKEDGKKLCWNCFTHTTCEMRETIRKIVGQGFDYVLTTNYSYEIEAALMDQETLTREQIKKLMNFHEVSHAQTQFLVNTYNLVGSTPVWHIHGEARKPDSMIIGNYYYGKQLRRCVQRLYGWRDTDDDKASRSVGKGQEFGNAIRNKKPNKIGSWIDAFVLGDVYILGLGLDFSELDLWWLIEYKSNHKDYCGRTIFYEPRHIEVGKCPIDRKEICYNSLQFVDKKQCRDLLLTNSYGVIVDDLGVLIEKRSDYKRLYENAICEFESINN